MPRRFEAGGVVPSWRIFVSSEMLGVVAREPTALPVPITVTDMTWPFLVQVVVYPVVLQIVLVVVGIRLAGMAIDPCTPQDARASAQTSPTATSATSRLIMRSSVAHFRTVCRARGLAPSRILHNRGRGQVRLPMSISDPDDHRHGDDYRETDNHHPLRTRTCVDVRFGRVRAAEAVRHASSAGRE
jgi:hypothetical protein